MSNMFGRRINEFVLSTGTMDKEIFFDFLRLVHLYVDGHLNITYLSVLNVKQSPSGIALTTVWGTRDENPVYPIDKYQEYDSLTSFSFGKNKPIWIVSESKGMLKGAEDLKDLWKSTNGLPCYNTPNIDEVRTSVMHPLTKDGRAIGIVEFSANKYIEPTPSSLEEVQMLAATISKAYQKYENSIAQQKNTKDAMQSLERSLETQNWNRLALPQIFVAYPGVERLEDDAKTEHNVVIAAIRAVLDEFADILQVVYWQDVSEAGNITDQVIRDISESDFGLCYFSEPITTGQYQDNANVLFEAGMMQALANSPNSQFKAWVPVREKDAPSIPFDIASERMLFIHRDKGTFNKEINIKQLRERVISLLDLEDEDPEYSTFFQSLKKRFLPSIDFME